MVAAGKRYVRRWCTLTPQRKERHTAKEENTKAKKATTKKDTDASKKQNDEK
jgi:hypothetical protein